MKFMDFLVHRVKIKHMYKMNQMNRNQMNLNQMNQLDRVKQIMMKYMDFLVHQDQQEKIQTLIEKEKI